MHPDPAPPTLWQQLARIAAAAALIAVGVWVLHEFIAALVWAVVLAIAFWPLYDRLPGLLPRHIGRLGTAALATSIVAVIFLAPLALLGLAVARESHFVIGFIAEARHNGIAPPSWISDLPAVGPALTEWWNANLADPLAAEELIGRVNLHSLSESARHYGREIAHRLALFFFALLTLFFLFRDGDRFAVRLRRLGDRVIGVSGERIGLHMIAAVHGTVNGLVLVGLGEGVILGVVYFAAGLPYPATVGAITAVAAVIPFAAPVVYTLAGLYLLAIGKTAGGVVVLVGGSIIVFVADHFVRPVLIGGAARLPFLWVLLGLLGGLTSFGFLGLFLGPAVMAALVALWRDWTEPDVLAEPAEPAPPPSAVPVPTIAGRQT